MPQNVIEYLLKRMDRSHAALAQIIERLDRKAYEQGRRITVNLAREVMTELGFIDL